MAYLTIEDFKAGLDTRRMEEASAAGSLQTLKNAHINRGGEIEKAKAWVSKYTLPAGTFSLFSASGLLYVFGSPADPGVPSGITYQQIISPDAVALQSVDTLDNFKGQVYVVGTFADSLQYHFLDGVPVSDWYEGLVRPQMNTANYDAFLTEFAAFLNQDEAVGASYTPGTNTIVLTGRVVNVTFTVDVSTLGGSFPLYSDTPDQTITANLYTAASATDQQVTNLHFGGTCEGGDRFTVILNTNNYYGAVAVHDERVAQVKTHKSKVYAAFDVNLGFSGVADATGWKPQDIGSGTIDMSAESSSDEALTGLGVYQNKLAVFGPTVTQIWNVDADPDLNTQLQVLDNIGTRAKKTIKSFGDSDVFFLSDFGIRSLRARDASNSAGITDVGTPIDDLVIAHLETLTIQQHEAACSAIEPNSGRYIMSLGLKQYIFSYFPSSKISAWSTWEPGFNLEDFAALDGRLYARSGNIVYLLGGDGNDEYTSEQVVVETPYLDARSIATWKEWTGIDLILEGQWDVYINTNPAFPNEFEKTATITRTSIGEMNLKMAASAEVIKFKFVHQGSGPAKISKIIVHYNAKWAG